MFASIPFCRFSLALFCLFIPNGQFSIFDLTFSLDHVFCFLALPAYLFVFSPLLSSFDLLTFISPIPISSPILSSFSLIQVFHAPSPASSVIFFTFTPPFSSLIPISQAPFPIFSALLFFFVPPSSSSNLIFSPLLSTSILPIFSYLPASFTLFVTSSPPPFT